MNTVFFTNMVYMLCNTGYKGVSGYHDQFPVQAKDKDIQILLGYMRRISLYTMFRVHLI